MEVNETRYHSDVVERKEKAQAVLARLQSLKCKVSELKALVCNECGKPIKEGNKVTVKDTFGAVKSYYHEDCFKTILSSQV
jgi:hypothetical protein